MNTWDMWMIYFFFLFICIVAVFSSFVAFIATCIKKKSKKKPIICFLISIVSFFCVGIYIESHSTYYKYNDWWVEQNNIIWVQEKYGDFDLGNYEEGKAGVVAYYIYTDNGPVMPDHMKHYYYIEYDCWGVVSEVYDAGEIGG